MQRETPSDQRRRRAGWSADDRLDPRAPDVRPIEPARLGDQRGQISALGELFPSPAAGPPEFLPTGQLGTFLPPRRRARPESDEDESPPEHEPGPSADAPPPERGSQSYLENTPEAHARLERIAEYEPAPLARGVDAALHAPEGNTEQSVDRVQEIASNYLERKLKRWLRKWINRGPRRRAGAVEDSAEPPGHRPGWSNGWSPSKSSERLRQEWEEEHRPPWPRDAGTGRNLDASHRKPLADGGGNEIDNIEPLPPANTFSVTTTPAISGDGALVARIRLKNLGRSQLERLSTLRPKGRARRAIRPEIPLAV